MYLPYEDAVWFREKEHWMADSTLHGDVPIRIIETEEGYLLMIGSPTTEQRQFVGDNGEVEISDYLISLNMELIQDDCP